MKKRYFIWKDKNCGGVNPEWVELSAKEFFEFCQELKRLKKSDRRYFYRLPGLDEDDTYYFFECTYEKYLESHSEKEKRRQRKKEREEFDEFFEFLSMDALYEDNDSELTDLHDVVADASVDVENEVASKVCVAQVEELIMNLPTSYRQVAYDHFINNMSINQVAKKYGISKSLVQYRISQSKKYLKNFI